MKSTTVTRHLDVVTWSLDPQTFWRRTWLGRVRQHQLITTEVSTSLVALRAAVEGAAGHE